jgi:hypothetical protein
MTSIDARRRAGFVGVLAGAVGLGVSALGGATSRTGEHGADARVEGLRPFVYRASHCAACHNQDRAATYAADERAAMICRMNEWATFDGGDRHAVAHAALTSERGRVMGERLGIDAATDRACAGCHVAPAADLPGARAAEGVTCVGCHGAYANWVEAHARVGDPEWGGLGRAAKERDYGMVDLWNVTRRAELCASCHVGDAASGRVLTHAMYAAGHPPLPPFELASHSRDEPRHWELLREKSAGRRERLGLEADRFERTREVLAGAVASLKAAAGVTAAQAGGEVGVVGGGWPDFARFDCAACHHGLRGPGAWRQARGYRNAAGRPPLPEWPGVVAMLAPGGDRLGALLDAWNAAATARPFGDAERVASAAREVVAGCEGLLGGMDGMRLDVEAARGVLGRIAGAARRRVPDAETARVLALAARVVVEELGDEAPGGAREAVAELDRALGLDLRGEGEGKVPVGDAYGPRLERAAGYEPGAVRGAFELLERSIP